jgi:hypothetical protein
VEFLKQFLLCLQDRSLDFHALCALYAVTGNVFCRLALGFASSVFWNLFMLFFLFLDKVYLFFPATENNGANISSSYYQLSKMGHLRLLVTMLLV